MQDRTAVIKVRYTNNETVHQKETVFDSDEAKTRCMKDDV